MAYHTEEGRKRISESMRGKRNPNWGGGLIEYACEVCGEKFKLSKSRKARYCSKKCYGVVLSKKYMALRRRVICANCGKIIYVKPSRTTKYCSRACMTADMGAWLKVSGTSKKYAGGFRADIGIYVRSQWEANYARYLNWLKEMGEIYTWEYEPDTFEFEKIKRGTRFYTPDFKVWNTEDEYEYHEVKGYMDQKSKTRIKRMRKYYPGEPLIIIDTPAYNALARDVKGLVPNWESAGKTKRNY